MKKFITTITVLALTASVLAGCGSQEENTESTAAAETASETAVAETEGSTENSTEAAAVEYGPEAYVDGINVADYVTLGEYKGIEVSVDAASVSDEYLQSYIDYVLQSNMVTEEITDRPVETGDIVNIDYEGKIDGVAFDGGTDQGYDLEIGSGSFIDGFEDGLIGAEVGETRDVTTVFPDDYRNTEVAGKEAIFTVTVNSISTETLPELTDEFVQGLGEDLETVDEFRQYAYDMLMEDAQSEHDSNAQAAVLAKVVENSTLQEPPADMVTRYYDRIKSNMSSYASMYGYDLETFMSASGTTEEQLEESGKEASREIIVMQAIADAEGLTVTEEELDAELEANATQYGYESVEDYKAVLDVKGYQEYMMTEKVLSFLLENAVVTDVEAAETESTETAAETESEETEADGTETTETTVTEAE